ncbi:MAG: DegT/DnrJ/EryC1/StrS family aminotransferase [Methylococcales bacterium]
MWKVPLFKLNFDHQESDAVSAVIESRWLTMGERIQSFESTFAENLGGEVFCTALSSCTAALHLALLALDVGNSDEVVIPALTFVADINAVEMVGATPVLADCGSYANWNVTADSIKACLTEKTKAVIVVHFAGYPCEMDAITALCKERGIRLIEDVAHAPGASYKGQTCGTFGDFGCFSFFTNKNLSIGEGGMLSAKSAELSQQAQFLRSHGMTTLTLDRHKGRAISYDVVRPGLNYRMDEIRAAIGLVQLSKLQAGNLQRGVLVERCVAALNECEKVTVPFIGLQDCVSAYHILPVLLDKDVDRISVINAMKNKGVQTSIHYPSFRQFSAYKDRHFQATPIADDIAERVLTLPLFPSMSFGQMDWVIESLLEALG